MGASTRSAYREGKHDDDTSQIEHWHEPGY